MNGAQQKPRVTIIGGGMITRIQLLPTIYQLQREGVVGEIHICALNAAPLKELQEDATLRRGFGEHSFVAHPDPAKVGAEEKFPELFKEVLAEAPRGSIMVLALPDQLHYGALDVAIKNDLHVCTVKPLVLQSVLMGTRNASAMISGNLLAEGENIQGWTLQEINPRYVVLTWKEHKHVLKLPE